MNFDLTEDQQRLAESLGRLLGSEYRFDRRRVIEAEGWSPPVWAQFAAMGLLGLPFAEADGGFGGHGTDVMMVMEAFGRALVLEPYLGGVVLAGTALRYAADEVRIAWVEQVAAGTLILGWAHTEREARHELSFVATKATQTGDAWRLDGKKSNVLHGAQAELLIVSARLSGDVDEPDGLRLFTVPGDAPGLGKQSYRLQDGRLAADLTLNGVSAQPLGTDGWPIIQAVTEAGIAAACADALGAMETAHALTVDYLKTRQQFGRAIGSNQALQHRAAEMLVELELARSMTMLAAMMLKEPDPAERALNIGRAKLVVGRAARTVGQQAMQLHGGIGVTEEYQVGHCLKRLLVFEQMFGDTAYHLATLAEKV